MGSMNTIKCQQDAAEIGTDSRFFIQRLACLIGIAAVARTIWPVLMKFNKTDAADADSNGDVVNPDIGFAQARISSTAHRDSASRAVSVSAAVGSVLIGSSRSNDCLIRPPAGMPNSGRAL